jgi:hypothetical protein
MPHTRSRLSLYQNDGGQGAAPGNCGRAHLYSLSRGVVGQGTGLDRTVHS